MTKIVTYFIFAFTSLSCANNEPVHVKGLVLENRWEHWVRQYSKIKVVYEFHYKGNTYKDSLLQGSREGDYYKKGDSLYIELDFKEDSVISSRIVNRFYTLPAKVKSKKFIDNIEDSTSGGNYKSLEIMVMP